MSSSTIIATRKRNILLAHICSECGFPMISIIQIEAQANKSYTFAQSKAEQIASEMVEKAVDNEISWIESCLFSKAVLDEKPKSNTMISSGCFCTSSFSGHLSQCPKCLNVEPWQSTLSKKKMSELKKNNFPKIFSDASKAENWAKNAVINMAADCIIQHEDKSVAQEAIKNVIDSKIQINAWMEEINSIPEYSESNRLKEELSYFEKMKSRVGVLDFKNQTVLSNKITKLKLQIKRLEEIADKERTPLAEKIAKAENELLFTQSIAFGCSYDVFSKKRDNACSYFLSPNDIPDEILLRIKDAGVSFSKDDTNSQESSLSEDEAYPDVKNPIFCRKCGYKLLPDSSFCSKCGMKVK